MSSELVTIIIPLYNSAEYISKCVSSCLSQTYENIEVIIVDDGSIDDGLNIVRQMALSDERLKLLHKENGGVSSARNMGIDYSRGKYICFVDADDFLESDFVEVMVAYMKRYKADFCFSENIYGTNIDIGIDSKVISRSKAEMMLLGPKINVGCWNKMYKKSVLKNIEFDETLFYGEGLKFIIRIAHDAERIVLCSDCLYHYRKINPNSATTKFDLAKMANGEKALLEVKNIISGDKKVERVWKQHYALFCINSMLGLLKSNRFDRAEYIVWKKKFRDHALAAICAVGSLKIRARILIAFVSPCLLKSILSRCEKIRKG